MLIACVALLVDGILGFWTARFVGIEIFRERGVAGSTEYIATTRYSGQLHVETWFYRGSPQEPITKYFPPFVRVVRQSGPAPRTQRDSFTGGRRLSNGFGFFFLHESYLYNRSIGFDPQRWTKEPLTRVWVAVPYWFLLVLGGGSAWWLFRPALRRRRDRRRLADGKCIPCGYDLRAHKPGDKCPECGATVPHKDGGRQLFASRSLARNLLGVRPKIRDG